MRPLLYNYSLVPPLKKVADSLFAAAKAVGVGATKELHPLTEISFWCFDE